MKTDIQTDSAKAVGSGDWLGVRQFANRQTTKTKDQKT
jgi:hypothetical protein